MTASPPGARISIRRAQAADVDGLARIYVDTARAFVAMDGRGYHQPDPAVLRSRIVVKLSDAALALYVAAIVDDVVGLLELELVAPPPPGSLLRSDPAVQVGVAVREDRRGAGIGTTLMRFAERWATQHGRTMLVLSAAFANSGARRLYERLGYEPYGVIMRKSLHQDLGS